MKPSQAPAPPVVDAETGLAEAEITMDLGEWLQRARQLGHNVQRLPVEALAARPLEPELRPFAGRGHPLPAPVRAPLEAGLGRDLSRLKVHADSAADRLNRRLRSNAAASGRHLFFKRNQYRPDLASGRHLIGHEVAHAVQQEGVAGVLQRATDPEQIKKTKVLGSFEFDGLVGDLITARDQAMGGVVRDANLNNLAKRKFEEALATFVFRRWDLVETAVLKVSKGVDAYLKKRVEYLEKQKVHKKETLKESMARLAEKPTTLGYPGFPSDTEDFDPAEGSEILRDALKGSLPTHLNVHGKFSYALYTGEAGDRARGIASGATGAEAPDYLDTLLTDDLFGTDPSYKDSPDKGRPRLPMPLKEKDERPQAERLSGLEPKSFDQALPVPEKVNERPTHSRQRHSRGGDFFFLDESKRWTQEARLTYDMPVMAGPSGSAAYMLNTAKVMGLQGEDLWLYSMALVGSIVGGGHHSFHEIMTVAKLAGVPYTPGDYLASIPPTFWKDIDFRKLVGHFFEPAGQFAERTRSDEATSESRAQDLQFGLPPLKDDKEGVYSFLATRLGTEASKITLEAINQSGGDTKGVSGSPVWFVLVSGKRVGVLKKSQSFEEMAQELSGMEKLHDLDLKHLKTPKVLGLAKESRGLEEKGLILSALAPGQPLDDVMVDVGKVQDGNTRSQLFDSLKSSVRAVGRGLADLHVKTADKPIEDGPYFRYHKAKIESYASEASKDQLALAKGLDPGKLGAVVEKVVETYGSSPDRTSLVHGDAHPGNFFVDLKTGGVTAIDLPTLDLSAGKKGRPLGSPARDVANFARKLESVGAASGLTKTEVSKLQNAFEKGYSFAGGEKLRTKGTPGAQAFFRLRTLLSELRNALKNKDENAVAELIGEIMKLASSG